VEGLRIESPAELENLFAGYEILAAVILEIRDIVLEMQDRPVIVRHLSILEHIEASAEKPLVRMKRIDFCGPAGAQSDGLLQHAC